MNKEMPDPAWNLFEKNVVVSGEIFDRYKCTRGCESCFDLASAGNLRPKTACRNPEARARRFQ